MREDFDLKQWEKDMKIGHPYLFADKGTWVNGDGDCIDMNDMDDNYLERCIATLKKHTKQFERETSSKWDLSAMSNDKMNELEEALQTR